MESNSTRIVQWRTTEYLSVILENKKVEWRDVFNNDHSLDLEIGIGNGSFLVPYAKNHPERNILGIEIEGKYLKKADKKLIKQDIRNARLLIGDAKLLVWKMIPDSALSNLFIHFPDPWFKKRHKKRRMINPFTIKLFARKIESFLIITTDDAEYKDWVKECIEITGCFEPVFPSFWAHSMEDHYETKYERKWRNQGKEIYFMKFRKTGQPDIDFEEYQFTQNLNYPLQKFKEKIFNLTSL